MTTVYSFGSTSTSLARPKSVLTIGMGLSSPFKYKFSMQEVLLENSKALDISLESEFSLDLLRYKIDIVEHCCTRPTAMKRVEFNDTNQEITKPYDPDTKLVTYRLDLDAREMVMIGIVVRVRRNDDTLIGYMLCDPQVGNGPPTLGGFYPAEILSVDFFS
jgi:hypothetical protein